MQPIIPYYNIKSIFEHLILNRFKSFEYLQSTQALPSKVLREFPVFYGGPTRMQYIHAAPLTMAQLLNAESFVCEKVCGNLSTKSIMTVLEVF